MGKVRLFIALPTPHQVADRIGAIRDDLRATRADVRWEPDDKLHATLKFLGDTDEQIVPALITSIEGIARSQGEVRLTYEGLGCFPDTQRPNVIWAGITASDDALSTLHEKIESAMESFRFERERRQFRPHLTLGRVKGPKNLQSLIARMESVTLRSEPATIRDIELVKSELRPGGSVYTILRNMPFGGTETGNSPPAR